MASDPNAPRSRRALLTAAAGAAGAVAASAAMPLAAAAADDDPVLVGNAHTGTTETSITATSAGTPQIAFKARTVNPDAAALVGSTGDETDIQDNTSWTGVYGFSPASTDLDIVAAGVWGDSADFGVIGDGGLGGVIGFGGNSGVVGVGVPGGFGVWAFQDATTDVALRVDGKVQFSRAGKSTIGAGKSSLKITLAGTSANSRIFAVLHSNRSGRYVRAVVPTTGSFTIYLNTTVTAATYVAWFVIN